uniref:Uncharacterized protein n=1 Tax=Rhizophora mucronata TaxID=61149 RepID=A0A2P2PYE1_RHIMU
MFGERKLAFVVVSGF